jgi:hypothetical protein
MQMRITLHLPVLRLALLLVVCCVLIGEWNSKLFSTKPVSRGVPISLLLKRTQLPGFCDLPDIITTIGPDNRATINQALLSHFPDQHPDILAWDAEEARLAKIFATSTAKVVYVKAEPDLSYGEYVSDLADLNAKISDLNLVLMTQRQVQGDSLSEIMPHCIFTFRPTLPFAFDPEPKNASMPVAEPIEMHEDRSWW